MTLGVTRLIVNLAAASAVALLATASSDFFISVPYFTSVYLIDEDTGSKTFDDYIGDQRRDTLLRTLARHVSRSQNIC